MLSNMNEIRVTDNPPGLRYELWLDGELTGWIDYRLRRGTLVLLHTEVTPPKRERGLGTRLVHDALEDVRERDLHMKPVCPFVAAYVRENPEYGDLVAR